MYNGNSADDCTAASAKDAIDMSGVDPMRYAEMRRRVSAVRSFLDIETPEDADRVRYAVELGLSVNQFLALVRTWREHGRASAISGSGASKGAPRPGGRRNLPTSSKAAAIEVIAASASETSLVEIVRLVRERCEALRVVAPSRSTIWNMVMSARRARNAEGVRDHVLVSKCHVKLPMTTETGIDFPELILAVDMATGTILAGVMSAEPNGALKIAAAIRSSGTRKPVLADTDLTPTLTALIGARVTPMKPSAARTDTAKVLGRGFGTLELIYQRSRSISPADMLRSRKDEALSADDVRLVVADQIAAHNTRREDTASLDPRGGYESPSA